MSIFKAYDIRGVYPVELDEKMAEKIAKCFARMRQGEITENRQITLVLGRDMRLSSPSLFVAVKQSLLSYGVKVIDVGLVSTPAFYFAVSFYGYDGGIMVSASHNPSEFNGLKLVRDRALPFGQGMGMEELSEMVQSDIEVENSDFQGVEETLEGVNEAYTKFESERIDVGLFKKFKIVVDTANSMGATYIEPLIRLTPQIEWLKMNFELDGSFPSHEADPLKEDNNRDLMAKVLEMGADLGVAIDGDGDRIFFVDNNGKMVEPGIVRGMLAKLFLRDNPGAVICYDARPGKITVDMILENGGKPAMTRVGHSLIKNQMIKEGAVFGGESSGHFFVKFPHGVYEAPVLVMLKILLELSEAGLSFAEYIKPMQKYFHSGEINFHVNDKMAVIQKLKEIYLDAEKNELDGVTFTYPEVWFNVRLSNTEPVLRLNVEGNTKEAVNEIVAKVREIIED